MPSRLYELARSLLDPAGSAMLDRAEQWLAALNVAGDDGSVRGARILENVQREAHFSSHNPVGEGRAYAAFLRSWAEVHQAATTDGERLSGYCSQCDRHPMEGTLVPDAALPARLLRYLLSRSVMATLIRRMLGRAAMAAFLEGRTSPHDALVRMVRAWDLTRLEPQDRLAGREVVFATFDHPGGAPRNDAQALAEALALPAAVQRGREPAWLLELAYSAGAVGDHRIPTVADAGWTDLFEPAPEGRPDPRLPETCYGWTRPLGKQVSQPEVVHANEALREVGANPRFVGRIGS